MNVIVWIIFGALVGWITSMVMGTSNRQGIFGDILLGILGALVGGFIMNLFNQPGVTGFNIYSFIVAMVGAIILVAIGKLIRRQAY